jgi:hypothetical protein
LGSEEQEEQTVADQTAWTDRCLVRVRREFPSSCFKLRGNIQIAHNMVSLKVTLMALAAAVFVHADYYIDPNSVSLAKRKNWCDNELSSCPLICEQSKPSPTLVNTCDPVSFIRLNLDSGRILTSK